MARSERDFYSQVIGRISLIILILGSIGTVALSAIKGLNIGFGFLIGAALSYVSFWRWQQVVSAIGPGSGKKSPWMFILRILALGVAAYVIIKFLGLNVGAVLAGLLVSAASVIIELIYELIYART